MCLICRFQVIIPKVELIVSNYIILFINLTNVYGKWFLKNDTSLGVTLYRHFLIHSNCNFFSVSQICFTHCQLFQETLILLSIQVTLAGRSIWLILFLLSVFNFGWIGSKAAQELSAELNKTVLKNCKSFEIHRYQRAKPIIIDPGLYSLRKSDVFWMSEQRRVPSAYRLFTGEEYYFCCLFTLSEFLCLFFPTPT